MESVDPFWIGIAFGAVGLALAVVAGGAFLRSRMRAVSMEEEGPALPAPTERPSRWAAALAKSRAAMSGRLDEVFGRGKLDEEAFEALEEALLIADVGLPTAEFLLKGVRKAAGQGEEAEALRAGLKAQMTSVLAEVHRGPLEVVEPGPWVILVVGVNGSGKTTTIGKLAHRYVQEGKSVLVAAGDTFRAAAAEQLGVWAERSGAEFVRQDEGSDPGAVVYQAMDQARSSGVDVVIVDTAGRLQTMKPLMDQLAKMQRVIQKTVPEGPHETLLVLDGTMGQNGLSQAAQFNEATPLTGVVVTKLDGTAKGGMVLAIAHQLGLSVRMVGIGEGIDDLRDFEVEGFVEALV